MLLGCGTLLSRAGGVLAWARGGAPGVSGQGGEEEGSAGSRTGVAEGGRCIHGVASREVAPASRGGALDPGDLEEENTGIRGHPEEQPEGPLLADASGEQSGREGGMRRKEENGHNEPRPHLPIGDPKCGPRGGIPIGGGPGWGMPGGGRGGGWPPAPGGPGWCGPIPGIP